MLSTMRKSVVALGAAALLYGQPVYAAPVQPEPTVDALVALSVLGTAQSRAAVCGKSATCGLPMAIGASAAAASPAVTTSAAVAAQGVSEQRQSGLLMVILIGGAMVLIAVLAATLEGNGGGEPISPA